MSEGRIEHEILEVESIDDPLPRSSFGTIGRFVVVRWPEKASLYGRVNLEVPYSDEDLRWVDPATLRLFEIDVDTRQYALLPGSGVDTERRRVYGEVRGEGVYGVVGLPRDPSVMRAVETFGSLAAELLEEHYQGRDDLKAIVCERFLGGGEALELGLGIELGPLGLPELQLLPVPSKWVPKDWPRPKFGRRGTGPLIYALLTDNMGAWSAGPLPPASAAVEIVDTRTWTRAGYLSLGSVGYVVSLEVAPDGQRLYILDCGRQQLRVVDRAGTSIATVNLGPSGGQDLLLDSIGSYLYIGTWTGLAVLDTSTLTVTQTVPVGENVESLAMSPDGATVAAVTGGNHLYLFDLTRNLRLSLVAITDPAGPSGCAIGPRDVVFSNTGRAVLWDPNCDRFYEVAPSGGQDHAATVRLTRDSAGYLNYNEVLAYSSATGRTYASKETGEVWSKVVGLGQASAKAISGFSGPPLVPTIAPGDRRLWLMTTPGGSPTKIDEYDTIAGTLTSGRYTFSDPARWVRSARVR